MCTHNELTSLKYSPTKAIIFNCSRNKLDNFHYAPSSIGSLIAIYNKINSLDGLQSVEVDHLNVSYNQLTSLKYCPNVNSAIFDKNKISSLEYLPQAEKISFFDFHDFSIFWKEMDGDKRIYERGDRNVKVFQLMSDTKIHEQLTKNDSDLMLHHDYEFWHSLQKKEQSLKDNQSIQAILKIKSSSIHKNNKL